MAAYLPYTVRASGITYRPSIATSGAGEWVNIGNYERSVGRDQYVRMSDNASEYEPGEVGRRVLFDAIKVVPYQEGAKPSTPEVKPGQDPDSSGKVMNGSSSDCSASGVMRHGDGGLWVLGLLGAFALAGIRRRREG